MEANRSCGGGRGLQEVTNAVPVRAQNVQGRNPRRRSTLFTHQLDEMNEAVAVAEGRSWTYQYHFVNVSMWCVFSEIITSTSSPCVPMTLPHT